MNRTTTRSILLLAFFVLSIALLVGCGTAPTPTTIALAPTETLTTVPSSPTSAGTPTPSALGITFNAQYDPTSNILTIYGTTPVVTIVVGGTPIKPLPTNTPTQTPIPTNTLPPTETATRPFIPPPPTRNLGIPADRNALSGRILFKTDREGGTAFGGQSGCSGSFAWYVMNADGSNKQKVENNSAAALCQAITSSENVSPDGQRIVIADRPFSTGTLYILDTQLNAKLLASGDSPGCCEWIIKTGFRLKSPVWSPASNFVVFVSNHELPFGQGCVRTTANIFKATPTQNPTILRLTNFCAGADADHPSFRGDGSQVVFWGAESGKRQVYVVDVGGDNNFDWHQTTQSFPNTGAHLISDGTANDWDPIWVK